MKRIILIPALFIATFLVLASQLMVFESEPDPIVLVRVEKIYVENPTDSLTLEERTAIERVVEGEARGASYEGKVWVATCLYNSMRYYNTDALNVISSGGYYGYNENVQPDTKAAVYRVFDLNSPIHENVRYFYAPSLCISEWHEGLHFVTEIDGHRFFEINEIYA